MFVCVNKAYSHISNRNGASHIAPYTVKQFIQNEFSRWPVVMTNLSFSNLWND